MICTYTGTTNRTMHGKGRPSIWIASRAVVLLTACLLAVSLLPSTVNAQATCSTLISNNPGLVSDCETLLAIRDKLDPTGGSLNWSADLWIGSWSGLRLGGTPTRVYEIHLFRVPLKGGTIPPELGTLTNLTKLDLGYGGGLTGTIPPELGNLVNLQRLYLDSQELSGPIPSELGNLIELELLELSNNKLSGEIPPELGNLTNLQQLWLNYNDLSGEIPPELENLTKLDHLYLTSNKLTGSIPPELGNLTNLWQLRLNDNELSGPVPTELGNLTNLIPNGLKLSGNDLCVPASHSDLHPFNGTNLPICTDDNETDLELTISVSPSVLVPHTEEVTLTAQVSDPTQVASYLWKRVPNGAHDLSTTGSLTLGGAKWPNSPGNRTFRVTITLNDGTQIAAEQSIAFTNPPPADDVSVSISVSPATSVPHTETVTLTAQVSDPSRVASYLWKKVGGKYDLSTTEALTLYGHKWPDSAGTRTFQVTVTLNDGSQVTADQPIAFTNP